jgi:O-antigen ligase
MIATLEHAAPVERLQRGVPVATSLPSLIGPVAVLAIHIPLGLVLQQAKGLATLHALVTLAIGVRLAYRRDQPIGRVAIAGAYIVSAEVLWRMTGAALFWEFGKYALSLVCLVALFRHRRLNPAARPLAAWYFALLLPSAALTFTELSFNDARQMVSFNLSGPFALFVSALFFTQVRLSPRELRGIFVAMLGPLVSVAVIAFVGIIGNPDIEFGVQSTLATSGNFGPNQVSAALGLGALVALLSMLHDDSGPAFKLVTFATMAFLAMQSALTFSRGGLYAFAGSGLLAFACSLGDGRTRARAFAVLALLGALVYYVALPRLNAWTDGKLLDRFENRNLTGRDEIAANDLEIWEEYPVFGVGPGRAGAYRQGYSATAASHTELTRALSEHGLFGLASLLTLVALFVTNVLRCESVSERAVTIGLIAWGVLFMLNAGMRLAAPSFAIGLSSAQLLSALPKPVPVPAPLRSVRQQ